MNTRRPPGLAAGAALGLSVFFALGCFQLPDDWVNQSIVQALDYRIDRPRVIAIALDPPRTAAGLQTTVDALIVAPDGAEPSGVSLDLCGWRPDLPVTVFGVTCYANEELILHLGDELPFSWTPSQHELGDCQAPGARDSGISWDRCSSAFPLMVRADFGGESAYGHVYIDIPSRPWSPGMSVPDPIADVPRTLTAEGPRVPGGEITLRVSMDIEFNDIRWYVDAGELTKTGRTRAHGTDANGVPFSENVLRVPEDWSGPLRVFVVIRGVTDNFSQVDLAWTSLTLEIAS